MGEFHALLMLGAVCVALILVAFRWHTLDHLKRRVVFACISTGVLISLAWAFFSIRPYRDLPPARFLLDVWNVMPFRQILVGGFLCFVATLVSPLERGLYYRVGVFVIAGILTVVLGAQFLYLNYSGGYLARPEYARHLSEYHSETARREVIRVLEDDLRQSRTACPAGWLRESPCLLVLSDDNKKYVQNYQRLHKHLGPFTIRSVWHTWFSGLYKIERQHWDFWYTGGQPTDLMRQIEVRALR